MNKTLLTALALAVAMLTATGCSAFRSQSAGNAKTTAASKKDKKKNTANSAAGATRTWDELLGEWQIVEVGDTRISQDSDQPYVNFAGDGRFYASNGCNIVNGTYTVKGADITFANVLTTMMLCPDVTYEGAVNAVLSDDNTVHALIQPVGKESYLYLNDRTGKQLMALVRHNMQFLNGQWYVSAINGKEVNDEEANVFFDIPSLKIHGNTGCNYFNGEIIIDPSVANSISFSGMGVTHMACPKGDQERTMLIALEETLTALAVDANTAALVNGNGQQVLTLTRANPK